MKDITISRTDYGDEDRCVHVWAVSIDGRVVAERGTEEKAKEVVVDLLTGKAWWDPHLKGLCWKTQDFAAKTRIESAINQGEPQPPTTGVADRKNV